MAWVWYWSPIVAVDVLFSFIFWCRLVCIAFPSPLRKTKLKGNYAANCFYIILTCCNVEGDRDGEGGRGGDWDIWDNRDEYVKECTEEWKIYILRKYIVAMMILAISWNVDRICSVNNKPVQISHICVFYSHEWSINSGPLGVSTRNARYEREKITSCRVLLIDTEIAY